MTNRAGEVVRVRGAFAYILILEWLGERDRPTGSDLHDFLIKIGYPSELVVCRSGDDVEAALAAATARVRDTGEIPVVQLEAHGSNPWEAPVERTCFGSGEGDGVLWTDLARWLAPLNEASGMRLLIVSATCWGAAIIGGLHPDHASPFAFSIGFETEVDPARLHSAMQEIYRSLRRGDDLPECVASAQRELGEGQQIVLDTALSLCTAILIRGIRRAANPSPAAVRAYARTVWDRWFPPALQQQNPAYAFVPERLGL